MTDNSHSQSAYSPSTGSRSQSDVRHSEAQLAGSPNGAVDLNVSDVLFDKFRVYAKERPEVVAIWCFGIGFVLGWKLKPW